MPEATLIPDRKLLARVLVPLDGSRLAEAVLPVATMLAARAGGSVTLLHVLEHAPPATVHGERHLDEAAEAERYLAEVAARYRPSGASIAWHVHQNRERDVARSIVEHATELDAGLIALCTHGRGGLRTLLFGTIAQRVLRAGSRPALIVRPSGEGPRPLDLRTVLVLLDGQAPAEAALPAALAVAKATGASLALGLVVPTVSTVPGDRAAAAVLAPLATAAILERQQEVAVAYLEEQMARLRAAGVEARAWLRRGDPATEVVALARELPADLVVMASHRRLGLDSAFAGSVAPRVLAAFDGPVLIVGIRAVPGQPRLS